MTPLKDIRLGDLPYSKNFKIDYTDPIVDRTVSVRSTFTASGSAGKPPTQPPTPARFRAKANAALGLKDTWERSLYPCITTAASLPLFGLGPIGQAAGAVIVPISGSLCAVYVKTMADEEKTINDPPLRSFPADGEGARARGRSSPSFRSARSGPAPHAALCQKLEPRMRTLLGAARNTESVAAAIETTISRETGALRAGNDSRRQAAGPDPRVLERPISLRREGREKRGDGSRCGDPTRGHRGGA